MKHKEERQRWGKEEKKDREKARKRGRETKPKKSDHSTVLRIIISDLQDFR